MSVYFAPVWHKYVIQVANQTVKSVAIHTGLLLIDMTWINFSGLVV